MVSIADTDHSATGNASRRPYGSWWSLLGVALPAWVLARVLVAIGWGVAKIAERRDWVDDPLARRTIRQGLLAWDGSFYADIAQHGYGALPETALRFFPLTALAGRGIGWFGVGPRAGVVILANIAALGAGVLLARLVIQEGWGEPVARRTVWLVTLAPSAFVLVLGYAEATALVLALGAFLCVRRARFGSAIPLMLLAGATRPGAFVLAVPIAVEAARGLRDAGLRQMLARGGAVLAPFVGTAVYLAWVGDRFGDAFLPYRVQTRDNLKGAFTNPVTSIGNALEGLLDGSRVGTGLHVVWMVVVVALIVVCFRRLPASYGWYCVASIASAVTSNNLDSFERYALSAFPIFIAAALLLAERRTLTRAAITLSGLAMTGYTALAFTHAYVP